MEPDIRFSRPVSPLVSVRPPGWIGGTAGPTEELLAWVQRAEALGFDGVFVGDRLLSEASHNGEPVYAASMLDVIVMLSAMAARTRRLLLGSLVLVVPYRHPVQLAKTIASLDVLSGGRVILGAGIGWNAREFEILGLPMAGRAERFEEALGLLRKLWTGETTTHHGASWQLDQVQVSPRPVRPGGPPVWLASFSPSQALDWTEELPKTAIRQLERVGRMADGWVPLVYSASSKRRIVPDMLGRAWDVVLETAWTYGRAREDIDFVYSDWCFVLDGPDAIERCQRSLARFFRGTWDDALRTYTIGTVDEVVDQIRHQTRVIDRVDHYVLTPLGDEIEQLDHLVQVTRALR